MNVKVKFFAYLREVFDSREREVAIPEESTVGSLLEFLCDTTKRREQLFDGPSIKPQIVIMKNGSPVSRLAALTTRIENGDVIAVFPFIGGG